MGTLAALIYVKINQSKILQSFQFQEALLISSNLSLSTTATSYPKKRKSPSIYNSEKISQILSFLSPLNELKQALKLREPKENLVYKIFLDVRGQNLREPTSAKQTKEINIRLLNMQIFTKHYMPFALEFYESLNDEQYNQINALILKLASSNICNLFRFKFIIEEKLLAFKSRGESEQHFQLELIRCSNIYSGNLPKKYIL